nr:MAG TPA: hypothetical protein [Caudoviricetes sp.]
MYSTFHNRIRRSCKKSIIIRLISFKFWAYYCAIFTFFPFLVLRKIK